MPLPGMTDRQVRREIEDARHAGAIIANDQDGRGYYVPTITEIEASLNESRLCIAHRQKPLRQGIERRRGGCKNGKPLSKTLRFEVF